ncbi:helix-turn-helix domain-containing protein [Anaeromusa acidaminophila]|uniref:helix-turn-helix domain-containing protein n=1 Tax=Anaeromusa acidaminophila TaxID=81464 RepID=UPI00036DDE28
MRLMDVMVISEAAQRWKKEVSTLRKACARRAFKPSEARKSGNVWLITEQGMVRVYGPEPLEQTSSKN